MNNLVILFPSKKRNTGPEPHKPKRECPHCGREQGSRIAELWDEFEYEPEEEPCSSSK